MLVRCLQAELYINQGSFYFFLPPGGSFGFIFFYTLPSASSLRTALIWHFTQRRLLLPLKGFGNAGIYSQWCCHWDVPHCRASSILFSMQRAETRRSRYVVTATPT